MQSRPPIKREVIFRLDPEPGWAGGEPLLRSAGESHETFLLCSSSDRANIELVMQQASDRRGAGASSVMVVVGKPFRIKADRAPAKALGAKAKHILSHATHQTIFGVVEASTPRSTACRRIPQRLERLAGELYRAQGHRCRLASLRNAARTARCHLGPCPTGVVGVLKLICASILRTFAATSNAW